MRAYKVVKIRGSRLRSCIIMGKTAGVTYIPGKEVHAPEWLAERGYHLCVFKRLDDAKNFRLGSNRQRIWLVDIKGVIRNLPPILNSTWIPFKDMSHAGGRWPSGTIMAKSVTLIKEVEIK